MTSTSPVFSYQPQQSGGAMESNLQVSIPNQNNYSNKVKKLGGVIKGLGVFLKHKLNFLDTVFLLFCIFFKLTK